MILFLFFCHLMLVLSRSPSGPAVLTQYSLAQNYLAPYPFFSSKCISNIFKALSPFGNHIICEVQYLRGLYNSKWVWMLCTYLSNVATIRIHSDCCLTMSLAGLEISPVNILNQRLRNHKSSVLPSGRTCANFLKSPADVQGAFYPRFEEIAFFGKVLSFNCKPTSKDSMYRSAELMLCSGVQFVN